MVPRGKERLRVVMHAGNTEKDIDDFVLGLREWAEAEMHVIGADVDSVKEKEKEVGQQRNRNRNAISISGVTGNWSRKEMVPSPSSSSSQEVMAMSRL